jgi:ABC-type nitrate/sulfonate/bicarbonate transport system permease component
VLAMIGAIVGEYFGGAFTALGVLINSRSTTFQFKEAWAGIGVACAFGIAFYLAVALVERLALRGVASTGD